MKVHDNAIAIMSLYLYFFITGGPDFINVDNDTNLQLYNGICGELPEGNAPMPLRITAIANPSTETIIPTIKTL